MSHESVAVTTHVELHSRLIWTGTSQGFLNTLIGHNKNVRAVFWLVTDYPKIKADYQSQMSSGK